MDVLEQHDLQQVQSEDHQQFKITDLKSATWAMRKLRALDKDDAAKVAAAQEQIKDIQNWLTKEKQKNQDSREYFESLLSDYLYEERKADPKFKISTPYGTVSTRKSRSGVTWPSDDRLVELLAKQGLQEFIRTKQEPDKAAIQKRFKFVGSHYVDPETGIVIEGAQPKPTTEKTTFKIND